MGKKAMGLGSGFGDIIRDHSANIADAVHENAGNIVKIKIDSIDPNPFQPRKNFNREGLEELAENIKKHGILEPIKLRKHSSRYQIIDGERRFRAARIAGLKEVSVIIRDLVSDKQMKEQALIHNLQRENLNAIEIAHGYQQLIDEHSYTHEQLADGIVHKSRTSVTNTLRLLKLPEQVQVWIREGKIPASAARALISYSDPEQAAREIIEKGLNVREAENIVQKKNNKTKANKKSKFIDPDMQKFITDISAILGTKVQCKSSAKSPQKGTLLINYESFNDLTRIQQLLAGKN